jgi:TRAP-type C4-dicarboxylate transport system substrate-binding protein
MGMTKFAELVAAKSGGKIKVKLFPGGTLGGDAANVSALQGGTIEMAVDELRHPGQQAKGLRGLRLPLHVCQRKGSRRRGGRPLRQEAARKAQPTRA